MGECCFTMKTISCVFLLLLLCFDFELSKAQSSSGLLDKAKNFVQKVRQGSRPETSSTTGTATEKGTASKLKETFKKVNTKENRDKAKQFAKKVNTKENREKAKKLLKKIPSWAIPVGIVAAIVVLGLVGGVLYKKKVSSSESEEVVETE